MSNCITCGKALPPSQGKRARLYCDNGNKCKMVAQRRKAQARQSEEEAHDEAEWRSLAEDLAAAQTRIRELEHQLDIEKRFAYDTSDYSFKAWLKRQSPSDISQALLSWIEPRGSRSYYEARMRVAGHSAQDIDTFRDLWKRMLLEVRQ